jgi:PAS domain S-box-containing protein
VQSSEDAIISTSLTGIITTWNGGAEKLLGYTAGEALGTSISILLPRSARAEDVPMKALLDPSVHGQVSRFNETVFWSKSKVALPVLLTVSPIRDAAAYECGLKPSWRTWRGMTI